MNDICDFSNTSREMTLVVLLSAAGGAYSPLATSPGPFLEPFPHLVSSLSLPGLSLVRSTASILKNGVPFPPPRCPPRKFRAI